MKQDITTPYGPMEVYLDGEGTPVIFLHGTGGSANSNWSKLIEKLRPKTDWQYIRPNLPGSGNSPVVEGELTSEIIAIQVLAVLDALNIEKAHIVGISLGASIALYLIGTYPERFLSVTSISGFIHSKAPRIQLMFNLWLDAIRYDHGMAAKIICLDLFGASYLSQFSAKELDTIVTGLTKRCNWQGMIQQIHLDQVINIEPALEHITQPVLILSGAEDAIITYDYANQLYHRLPQAKLIEVNTGHASTVEQPEEIANLLVDFIKSK